MNNKEERPETDIYYLHNGGITLIEIPYEKKHEPHDKEKSELIKKITR